MKVSIIIPTYNEEKVVRDCLESLAKQTYKDSEIIIVDDGSTDKTNEVLSEFQISNRLQRFARKFKIFRQNHVGPGAARNLGAVHAKGGVLVFVDSDMTFESDFIEKLVGPIVFGGVRGTFSTEEFVKNPNNVWSKCWGINEGWEGGRRHPKNYPNTQKVFRAILKSEFDKVNGFSLIGYNDDWTLSEKLDYEAIAATGAKFYHKNPETLIEVFRQAKWIGKRRYKLGKIGTATAVVRAMFPFSVLIGMFKSVFNTYPQFLVFKITYDFGVLNGAVSSLFGSNNAR